jgi:uncharacterized protein YdaU (DUF1376 family)
VKSPAFQFYPADFLNDENVVLMTNQEIGCYVKLICYCWREGSIPADVSKIAKLCGEDGSAMAQLWLSIKSCFSSAKNDDTRLVHPRLEEERKKQAEFKKDRISAGKKGAKTRWLKGLEGDGSAIGQPSLSHSLSIGEPMAKHSSLSSSSSLSSIDNTLLSQAPTRMKVLPDVDSDAYRLTCLLRSLILRNNPKARVPPETPQGLAGWCGDIDKLLRIDNREVGEVEGIIRWSQSDPFWLTNILSGKKLRDQFDKLVLRAGAKAPVVNRYERPPSRLIQDEGFLDKLV